MLALSVYALAFLVAASSVESSGIFDSWRQEDINLNRVRVLAPYIVPTAEHALIYGKEKRVPADVIDIMLTQGTFEVDARDEDGHTSLQNALLRNDFDAAEALIRGGASCDNLVLTDFCNILDVGLEAVKFLHRSNFDVCRNLFPAAVWRADGSILNFLFEIGCDVDRADDSGVTPLMALMVSDGFNQEMLDLFLERGGKLFTVDRNGANCLAYALKRHQIREERGRNPAPGYRFHEKDLERIASLIKAAKDTSSARDLLRMVDNRGESAFNLIQNITDGTGQSWLDALRERNWPTELAEAIALAETSNSAP